LRSWLAAAVVGVMLVEICWHLTQRAWWRRATADLLQALATFSRAVGDDARQQALMHAGRRALGLGLAALAGVVLIGAVLAGGLAVADLQADAAAYLLGVTVTATLWWAVRWIRARRAGRGR
jgi:hypothetical protein